MRKRSRAAPRLLLDAARDRLVLRLLAFGASWAQPFGLSPLTRALKSAPGRNLGTEDFGTSMVAPVAGLRAVRAGRSLFSNTPNPVMATLSPLATADWMVSSTAFRASFAVFLSPSRPEIASTSSRLFMFTPSLPPQGAWAPIWVSRPLTCPKVGDQTSLQNNHGQIGRRVGQYHTPLHPAVIRIVIKCRVS